MAKPRGQKAAANDRDDDEQAAIAADQEKYEDQGSASAPASAKPKQAKTGQATPATHYDNHPKFAKFKKGT